MFVLLQNLQQSSYAAKKAASQGLLDVALFLANVTELKHFIDGYAGGSLMAIVGIAILSLSLIIQMVIGLLIIMTLNIEGAITELTTAAAVTAGTPLTEEEGRVEDITGHSAGPSDEIVGRKFVLVRRARWMNTVVLCCIFIVVCLNMISSGLGLSNRDINNLTNNTT